MKKSKKKERKKEKCCDGGLGKVRPEKTYRGLVGDAVSLPRVPCWIIHRAGRAGRSASSLSTREGEAERNTAYLNTEVHSAVPPFPLCWIPWLSLASTMFSLTASGCRSTSSGRLSNATSKEYACRLYGDAAGMVLGLTCSLPLHSAI